MRTIARPFGAFLGYLGAALSATAYVLYSLYLLRGDVNTNIVTWGLWSIEAVLSFRIYKAQTHGDFAKYAEELVASVGCCLIAAMLVSRAYLAGADLLGPVEWIDGISALLFVVVYGIYRGSSKLGDVWPATLAFQGVIAFSAFPIVRSTFENPSEEPLLPWVLWASGFVLQFLCALLRQEEQNGHRALLTPFNYMFWHGLVAGIVYLNAAP